MPGKHAPGSSKSFYLSLGASIGGALAALALVLALVLVALNAGGNDKKTGGPAMSPAPHATTTKAPSVRPTSSSNGVPVSTVLAPGKTSTSVLNGTKRAGLAARVGDDVRKAGYLVVKTANAPTDHAKSTIYYRPDAEDEAMAFQKRFPRFTVVAPLPSAGYDPNVMLTVVIGADYPA